MKLLNGVEQAIGKGTYCLEVAGSSGSAVISGRIQGASSVDIPGGNFSGASFKTLKYEAAGYITATITGDFEVFVNGGG